MGTCAERSQLHLFAGDLFSVTGEHNYQSVQLCTVQLFIPNVLRIPDLCDSLRLFEVIVVVQAVLWGKLQIWNHDALPFRSQQHVSSRAFRRSQFLTSWQTHQAAYARSQRAPS